MPHESLAALVRAAFHDFSNKLSAMRLWIDVAARSGDAVDLGAVLEGVDGSKELLAEVRSFLVPADRFHVNAELARLQQLISSDLLRRGVELDLALDGDRVIEGRRDLFLQVVAAALLDALDAGGEGARWLLRLRIDGDDTALELHGQGDAQPTARVGLAREAFAPLLHDGGMHFDIWPGDRSAHDPDWILWLPK